jgi:hypothetical protein
VPAITVTRHRPEELRVPAHLNENQAGSDREAIGFPHLLICMGVVMQTGAWLYGYHFDAPDTTTENAAAFADFIATRGGNANNAVRLYGVANWSVRYPGGGKNDWRAEMHNIATALGYHGRASGFDTGIINPQDGTYVEFIPEFPQRRCRIYYKRNEKMTYTNVHVSPLPSKSMEAYSGNFNTGVMAPNPGLIKYTTGADIVTTPSNRGAFHELNYFLRLVTVTV